MEHGLAGEGKRRLHGHDGEEGLSAAMEEEEGHQRMAKHVCARDVVRMRGDKESSSAVGEEKGWHGLAVYMAM